ncbi:hypothetical protein Pcinc_021726 [Petrolisthes cinctipes]|uniref:Uncharacterized protein n=1 Tax=Petrolisthes cinctipes TaxID=88211 RepID=A0AAE1FFY1_PETCI|nr:hypothetical protein Pcinc_021726 [Petrolisthes cinctipes]
MFIPELPGCYPEYDHTLYQYLAATTCLLPYTRLGIEVVMKTHQLGTSSLASLHLLQFRPPVHSGPICPGYRRKSQGDGGVGKVFDPIAVGPSPRYHKT